MRFVQGLDYGDRKGTLGVALHMAEGGDGTVAYLAKRAGETRAEWVRRVRGVSANFVVLSTGEVVQMVAWDHASGSMNPADRSDTEGYYQREYIIEVLGDRYVDPNAYSLSVEITGFREQGPNAAQRDAVIGLVAEMRRRYPSIVGVYGHADQTDTKGCPGTALRMREIWAAVGHGKVDGVNVFPPTLVGSVKLRADQALRSGPSATSPVVAKVSDPNRPYPLHGQDERADPAYLLVDVGSATRPMLWVNVRGVTEVVPPDGQAPASIDVEVVVGSTTYAGEIVPR